MREKEGKEGEKISIGMKLIIIILKGRDRETKFKWENELKENEGYNFYCYYQ